MTALLLLLLLLLLLFINVLLVPLIPVAEKPLRASVSAGRQSKKQNNPKTELGVVVVAACLFVCSRPHARPPARVIAAHSRGLGIFMTRQEHTTTPLPG